MVSNNKVKIIVHVLYPCYICANEYSSAGQVINHVHNIHGYILEPRQVGHRRTPEDSYAFENDVKKKWDVQHFGCPSCWFHCPVNFETIMEHIMQEHKPAKVPGFVHENQEEDELASDTTDAEEVQEGEDSNNVQQLEITSDEEQATEGAGDAEEQPDEEQAVKKEGTPSASSTTSGGTSKAGSLAVQDNTRSFIEAETEVAKDLIQKMSDLNDMFKNLFSSKRSS